MNTDDWMASHLRETVMAKRRSKAAFAVSEAVRRWIIPPASYLKCADCGKRAQCYDHRDYSRPLDVWPVCYKCDAVRGSGEPYDGMDYRWLDRMLVTRARIHQMVIDEQRQLAEACQSA